MLLCVIVLVALASDQSPLTGNATNTAAGGNLPIVLELIATFLFGSLLFSGRERLPLSWPVLAVLLTLWVVSWNSAWDGVTGIVAIGYGVLVLGLRTPATLRRLTAHGDVSYGIYVYAFPVQQAVAAVVGTGLQPVGMLAIAYPITYGLGTGFLSVRGAAGASVQARRRWSARRTASNG